MAWTRPDQIDLSSNQKLSLGWVASLCSTTSILQASLLPGCFAGEGRVSWVLERRLHGVGGHYLARVLQWRQDAGGMPWRTSWAIVAWTAT
jgi:hypothetical protein